MESFFSYKRGGGEGKGLTELTELELGVVVLNIFYYLAYTKCEKYH